MVSNKDGSGDSNAFRWSEITDKGRMELNFKAVHVLENSEIPTPISRIWVTIASKEGFNSFLTKTGG